MQTFPTSPKVIHDTLVADSTFASYLGQYTFNSGATFPSISVLSPGENVEDLQNVEGIECIIFDAANISRTNFLTDDSDLIKTWRVFIVAWAPATGQDVVNATSRILSIFGGATAFETVRASDGLNAKVQTAIQIPSNSPILI